MTRVLVDAIVHLAAGLEFSDEERVDSRWAVKLLDNLTVDLDQLTRPEREAFIECLNELAKEESERQERIAPFYDADHKAFVKFLADFAIELDEDEEGED